MRPPDVPLPQAVAAAEDAVARLDERLATSPIANAARQRTHLHDAAAALFLEGELVPLEDLALHDAAADAHAPTIAVTRAHEVLRARRRIAAAAPGWAASPSGLGFFLLGTPVQNEAKRVPPRDAIAVEEDAFAAELADIDALIARSTRTLAGQSTIIPPASDDEGDDANEGPINEASDGQTDTQDRAAQADGLSRRQDRVEDQLATWHTLLDETQADPPVLAAARAAAAFEELALSPNDAWLGRLIAADLLRARGKTRHHLAALALGQKLARRETPGRRPRDTDARIAAAVLAIARAAEAGLADHDRWLTARRLLERKLIGRRSTSKLPELVEFVLRSPVVSTNTIAANLKISTRAAQNLVAELGLRELSGRSRYRCWGIL